jgi:hypothetical protein
MKIFKTVAFAIVALCFFGSAEAQVVVKARIGERPHHRVVVVHHRYYRHHYRPRHREVVVVRH